MQAVIAVGGSLSGGVLFRAQRLSAILIPASCEGSVLTFQGSWNGGVGYKNIYWVDPVDSVAKELSLAFVSDSLLLLPPDLFRGIQGIKVRTGTAASPVVQVTTSATLQLLGG